MTKFNDLALCERVLRGVTAEGYETPTPIQAQAIPHLLEGRDLLGIAQTGTGKTAAFALPTLNHIATVKAPKQEKSVRGLILAPTRELVAQIAENFRKYATSVRCRTEMVVGGVPINRQIRKLHRGCDVLVATPGRLLDLSDRGAIDLSHVEVLILDEADQMLDMGFIHDLKKIMAKVPDARQSLLFSATMPKSIADLAAQYLKDPVKVSVTPESTTAERVTQGVLHVAQANKAKILSTVLKGEDVERALVFTRTKHGADKVLRMLAQSGLKAEAIHGNKTQSQRARSLKAFKSGECSILVATDIAARGIDIDGISHVVNFEMPNVPEQYVHRIGRTARAGREGYALSLVADDEIYYLRAIEKITGQMIDVLSPPAGCADVVLPTPDRNARVIKPKGPAGRGGGQQRPPRKAKPGAGKAGGKPQHGKPQAKARRKPRPKRQAAHA